MTFTKLQWLHAAGLAVALIAGTIIGAVADQPHMHSALDLLRAARHQLEVADADKGGHRLAAIAATDNAIAETKLGIEYDRHH